MKKLLGLLAAAALLPVCATVSAAPAGNAARPIYTNADIPFAVGAGSDFVFERELDVDGKDVLLEKYKWFFVTGSYVIGNRAELYGMLGTADGDLIENYSGVNLKFENDYELAWGGGASVLLLETENEIRVGLDVSYRQINPEVHQLRLNGVRYSPTASGVSARKTEISEWQGAMAVSKNFGPFIGILGVKYSEVSVSGEATILGTTYSIDSAGSKENLGFFVGCLLNNTSDSDYDMSLGLEGRFVDEKAVSATLNMRF